MPRPKWFVNDRDVSIGDVVVFNRGDELAGDYKLGMIKNWGMRQSMPIHTFPWDFHLVSPECKAVVTPC